MRIKNNDKYSPIKTHPVKHNYDSQCKKKQQTNIWSLNSLNFLYAIYIYILSYDRLRDEI